MSGRRAWAAALVAVAAAGAFAGRPGGGGTQLPADALEGLHASGLVGVSLPGGTRASWDGQGDDLAHRLSSAGYGVRVDYAGEDGRTQVEQVRTMIDDGATALVVRAVDDPTLGELLALAHGRDVPVVTFGGTDAPGDGGRVAVVSADAPGDETVTAVRALLGGAA